MIYSRKILVLILAMLTFFVDADGQARKTIREGIDEISGKFDVRFVYDSSLDLDKTYRGRTDKTESLTEALETVFDGSGIVWTIEKEGHVVLARPQKPIVLTTAPEPHRHDTLTESRIVSDRHEQKIRSSLTGLERMDGKAFDKGFAVLSSPDVIKTLQTLPGVSAGTELISGLHVHGGTGHDNLFLLDGVHLYSVSHLAGLFSSFNTDVIESLDFYKSGFPARFGGLISYGREYFVVSLYRLSEELYTAYNNHIHQSADILGDMGLSPVHYSYTNVKGGFGVLGGISESTITIPVE